MVWRYRLAPDPDLRMSDRELRSAFARMDQHGFWDGSWWTPSSWIDESHAEAKISREGYIIIEKKEAKWE